MIRDLLRLTRGASWDWLDWGDIGNNWLLAEHDGTVVGCIMMNYGKPFCRLEFLNLAPTLTKRIRALAVRDLVNTAFAVCKAMGSQCAMSVIEWSTENQWMHILQRRGSIPCAEGVLLVKPL